MPPRSTSAGDVSHDESFLPDDVQVDWSYRQPHREEEVSPSPFSPGTIVKAEKFILLRPSTGALNVVRIYELPIMFMSINDDTVADYGIGLPSPGDRGGINVDRLGWRRWLMR